MLEPVSPAESRADELATSDYPGAVVDNPTAQPTALLDDPRLTLVGLFAESWTGLEEHFERGLQQEHGLSSQWFVLLLRIARSPGHRLRLNVLARQTGMSPSGLTRALQRLEDAGLARRVACPDDRRGAFAEITDQGLRTLLPAVQTHLQHLDESLLSSLTSEEQAQLSTLLRKIRDHVNPGAATPPDS